MFTTKIEYHRPKNAWTNFAKETRAIFDKISVAAKATSIPVMSTSTTTHSLWGKVSTQASAV